MSDHYNQPELADLYDDENVWDASADYYLDLARRLGAKTLLDLGCGTGTVTRGIVAAIGCSAVGLDPAAPMLAVARRKTKAEPIDWIEGDARTARLGRVFDLIIMTGHAFQGPLRQRTRRRCWRPSPRTWRQTDASPSIRAIRRRGNGWNGRPISRGAWSKPKPTARSRSGTRQR
jgi:SAM-dependent methyltransferase